MRRLHGLDALRGIAALIVFAHHLLGVYGIAFGGFAALLAVDLFFMLSGFILARIYDERFKAGLTPVRFIAARYKRLWAPIAIGAAIGLAYHWLAGALSVPIALSFFATASFLPALWIPNDLFILNWPAWSLFSEIFANLVHATFAKKRPLYLLALFIPAYLVTEAYFGGPIVGLKVGNVIVGLLRAGAAYFIGVLLYRSFGDKPLKLPPLLGIGLFVVGSFGLSWLPAVIAGPIFIFCIAPVAIRSALGLGRQTWAWVLGGLSFPLYATHAPISQLCFALHVPVASAAMIALVVGTLVAVLWEPQFSVAGLGTRILWRGQPAPKSG